MKNIIFTFFILFLPVILYGQVNGPTYENGVIRVVDTNINDVKLSKSNQKLYPLDETGIFNVAEKEDFNKYFQAGSMPPNIIIGSEMDNYESIVLAYHEVRINKAIYGFIFHYLIKENEDELLIAYDSNLDNDYSTDVKKLSVSKDTNRFSLNYTIENINVPIEYKNPTRDPSVFVQGFFLEGLKLSFLTDFEFGLGGVGNESYSLVYSDADVSSEFNYKYEFRTGHFAVSPSLIYKNIGLNINAIYEIRQPRNGFETIYFNEELVRSDNGVANIFPKARVIVNYGVFYQFLILRNMVVRPYINYGKFYYTGFASEEFNNVKFTKNILTYGSKFIFPTSKKGGFYLNLSFSNDIYEAVKDIKVRDGNTYPHRLNSNYVANQFNISFGYSIKVF